MNNLKVSTRLMLLIGVLSALLVAVGALGLFGISTSNNALKTVYEDRTVPTAQLGSIQSLELANRLALNVALLTPLPQTIAERTAQVEANLAAIRKTWESYMATYLTPEEQVLSKNFAQAQKTLTEEGLMPMAAALRAGDFKEAQRLTVEKVRPLSAYFSPSWKAFQADRGRDFSVIVDGVSV